MRSLIGIDIVNFSIVETVYEGRMDVERNPQMLSNDHYNIARHIQMLLNSPISISPNNTRKLSEE
jgi:hypothetical protein